MRVGSPASGQPDTRTSNRLPAGSSKQSDPPLSTRPDGSSQTTSQNPSPAPPVTVTVAVYPVT